MPRGVYDHQPRTVMRCPDCGKQDTPTHVCAARPSQQDLELAVLYRGGCTLQEIGDAIGLTRERVRQRITRIGMNKTETGWCKLDLTNLDAHPLALTRLGINADRHRARKAERRAAIITALQRCYQRTGRPPFLMDLARELGWTEITASLVQTRLRVAFAEEGQFASTTAATTTALAYQEAGVPQPMRGVDYGTTPDFWQRHPVARTKRDTCRKGGHPLKRDKNGTPRCPTCNKERYHAKRGTRG